MVPGPIFSLFTEVTGLGALIRSIAALFLSLIAVVALIYDP